MPKVKNSVRVWKPWQTVMKTLLVQVRNMKPNKKFQLLNKKKYEKIQGIEKCITIGEWKC